MSIFKENGGTVSGLHVVFCVTMYNYSKRN